MTFDRLLQEMPTYKNQLQEFIDSYKDSGKNIFIFGAKMCGNNYYRYLSRCGLSIAGIVDNYQTEMAGLRVMRPEEVIRSYPKESCVFVIAAPTYFDEIKRIF